MAYRGARMTVLRNAARQHKRSVPTPMAWNVAACAVATDASWSRAWSGCARTTCRRRRNLDQCNTLPHEHLTGGAVMLQSK